VTKLEIPSLARHEKELSRELARNYNSQTMQKIFPKLTKKEVAIFRRLNTPRKIQDFLNKIPQNFERRGETCMSPRRILRENTAHCIEGALFASAVLWYHGKRPLLMHFVTIGKDQDHVVALFKENGLWGAISKTNHAVLRYRDPVYKTPRELAMSYFHEYFLPGGRKNMLGYTEPIDLSKIGTGGWIIDEKDLWKINDLLFHTPHKPVAPKAAMRRLRPADAVERKYSDITEWGK